jgi:ATP-dependent protease HslVU (ClpYQ) peptidase subunit
MPKTVEVIVGEDGSIQLPDSISLKRDQRVLVTILEETDEENQDFEAVSSGGETALLSEKALAEDWTREEEDEAWKHLQPDQ